MHVKPRYLTLTFFHPLQESDEEDHSFPSSSAPELNVSDQSNTTSSAYSSNLSNYNDKLDYTLSPNFLLVIFSTKFPGTTLN